MTASIERFVLQDRLSEVKPDMDPKEIGSNLFFIFVAFNFQ